MLKRRRRTQACNPIEKKQKTGHRQKGDPDFQKRIEVASGEKSKA